MIQHSNPEVEVAQTEMSQMYNENLRRVLHLSREMLALADEGDQDRLDASCGILYGILRDMAYRLRKLAEEECDRHKNTGKWD
jgi:hypothetical protein